MNAIKTRFRNKLKSENLENLMFLALYPSEVIDYESLAFEIESNLHSPNYLSIFPDFLKQRLLQL